MHIKRNFWQVSRLLFLNECRGHLRAGQSCWLPMAFLLVITALWPLALPAEVTLLKLVAPGLIWIAILLAIVLMLDKLFVADMTDFALQHWLQSAFPLPWFVCLRLLSVSGLFILCASLLLPLITQLYPLSLTVWLHLQISLVLAVPTLVALGAIVSALLVGIGQRSSLLPLLIMPLWVPVLIFATSSIYLATQGLDVTGLWALLLALWLVSWSLAPFVISAALRMGLE